MDSGVQTRDNLQVLALIKVFAILGNFRSLGPPLLLSLAKFDPLFHGQVLAKLGECISPKTKTLEDGTVGYWVQYDVIVWSGYDDKSTVKEKRMRSLPSKVQHSETINVCLISRWSMHSVYTALDVSTSQSSQGIAGVDSDCGILRLDPLPLAFRVQDLECGDRLAEEESYTAQVCVAGAV